MIGMAVPLRRALCLLLWGAVAVTALDSPLKIRLFRQEKNGCGAAALAMVMHYWSEYYPLPASMKPDPLEVYEHLYLREIRGIRLASMRDYALHRDYHAFTIQGTVEDLETHLSKRRPIIVGLGKRPNGNLHFAVVVGIDTDRVWLNDPTKKKPTSMKRSKFEKRWAAADNWLLLAVPNNSN